MHVLAKLHILASGTHSQFSRFSPKQVVWGRSGTQVWPLVTCSMSNATIRRVCRLVAIDTAAFYFMS